MLVVSGSSKSYGDKVIISVESLLLKTIAYRYSVNYAESKPLSWFFKATKI